MFLLSDTEHLVICMQKIGNGNRKVLMLYKGIQQTFFMQKVKDKKSYLQICV